MHNKIYYNIKCEPKQLKPGSVVSYDLRPGNGTCLLWSR